MTGHEVERALALWVLLAPAALAQDRMIGLVEIPALHRQVNEGGADAPTAPLQLRAQPARDSAVAVVIRDRNDVESREHDYEQVSAVVYERVYAPAGGLWYRLRYEATDGARYGWLEHTDGVQYREMYALVSRGLAFFTADWDGRLWEQPAAASRSLDLADPSRGVRVIDVFTPRGSNEPWYLLAVVTGVCSGEPLEVITTGWVPAYAESGANTVWFHSRGC